MKESFKVEGGRKRRKRKRRRKMRMGRSKRRGKLQVEKIGLTCSLYPTRPSSECQIFAGPAARTA